MSPPVSHLIAPMIYIQSTSSYSDDFVSGHLRSGTEHHNAFISQISGCFSFRIRTGVFGTKPYLYFILPDAILPGQTEPGVQGQKKPFIAALITVCTIVLTIMDKDFRAQGRKYLLLCDNASSHTVLGL